MSDLVIGEGVALDLRLAKVPSRALAKLLDGLIQGLAALLLFVLVVALGTAGLDNDVRTAISIILLVLVTIGYPVLFETVASGRTPGKMALGVRVVRADGGPLRFRHALVRGLAGFFDFYASIGVLATVTSFCSRDGRRTGDMLAGTVVIRDRVPDAGTTPRGLAALSMPYPLFQWAQALDLTRLPDDLALAARQYLTRMYEMRPEVAARMGYDLATEMAQHVQEPPQGTPAWAYLAAVTAERRARQVRKSEAERRAAWDQYTAQVQSAWHQQAQQLQQAHQAQAQYAQQQHAQQQNVPTQRYAALQDVAVGQQQPPTVASSAERTEASSEGDGFTPPQ